MGSTNVWSALESSIEAYLEDVHFLPGWLNRHLYLMRQLDEQASRIETALHYHQMTYLSRLRQHVSGTGALRKTTPQTEDTELAPIIQMVHTTQKLLKEKMALSDQCLHIIHHDYKRLKSHYSKYQEHQASLALASSSSQPPAAPAAGAAIGGLSSQHNKIQTGLPSGSPHSPLSFSAAPSSSSSSSSRHLAAGSAPPAGSSSSRGSASQRSHSAADPSSSSTSRLRPDRDAALSSRNGGASAVPSDSGGGLPDSKKSSLLSGGGRARSAALSASGNSRRRSLDSCGSSRSPVSAVSGSRKQRSSSSSDTRPNASSSSSIRCYSSTSGSQHEEQQSYTNTPSRPSAVALFQMDASPDGLVGGDSSFSSTGGPQASSCRPCSGSSTSAYDASAVVDTPRYLAAASHGGSTGAQLVGGGTCSAPSRHQLRQANRSSSKRSLAGSSSSRASASECSSVVSYTTGGRRSNAPSSVVSAASFPSRDFASNGGTSPPCAEPSPGRSSSLSSDPFRASCAAEKAGDLRSQHQSYYSSDAVDRPLSGSHAGHHARPLSAASGTMKRNRTAASTPSPCNSYLSSSPTNSQLNRAPAASARSPASSAYHTGAANIGNTPAATGGVSPVASFGTSATPTQQHADGATDPASSGGYPSPSSGDPQGRMWTMPRTTTPSPATGSSATSKTHAASAAAGCSPATGARTGSSGRAPRRSGKRSTPAGSASRSVAAPVADQKATMAAEEPSGPIASRQPFFDHLQYTDTAIHDVAFCQQEDTGAGGGSAAPADAAAGDVCPICHRGELSDDDMVACDACQNWYHFICVQYDPMISTDDWYCPDCVSNGLPAFQSSSQQQAPQCASASGTSLLGKQTSSSSSKTGGARFGRKR